MNTERFVAYGLDALAYYFIPHWILNAGARKLAQANLNSAIQEKCGAAGVNNQDALQKEFATATKGGAFDVFYLPKLKIPFAGWRIPFFAVPNYVTTYSGALLANMPWVKNLAPIQNGTYAKALRDATGKIGTGDYTCKNGPPSSGGTPEPVTDPKEETVTNVVTADEATPVASMVRSAQMAGIPVTDLSGQLAQVYGSSAASPAKPSLSQASALPGAKPVLPMVPLVSPAPLTLPQVRVVPIVRPMPVFAR